MCSRNISASGSWSEGLSENELPCFLNLFLVSRVLSSRAWIIYRVVFAFSLFGKTQYASLVCSITSQEYVTEARSEGSIELKLVRKPPKVTEARSEGSIELKLVRKPPKVSGGVGEELWNLRVRTR